MIHSLLKRKILPNIKHFINKNNLIPIIAHNLTIIISLLIPIIFIFDISIRHYINLPPQSFRLEQIRIHFFINTHTVKHYSHDIVSQQLVRQIDTIINRLYYRFRRYNHQDLIMNFRIGKYLKKAYQACHLTIIISIIRPIKYLLYQFLTLLIRENFLFQQIWSQCFNQSRK